MTPPQPSFCKDRFMGHHFLFSKKYRKRKRFLAFFFFAFPQKKILNSSKPDNFLSYFSPESEICETLPYDGEIAKSGPLMERVGACWGQTSTDQSTIRRFSKCGFPRATAFFSPGLCATKKQTCC